MGLKSIWLRLLTLALFLLAFAFVYPSMTHNHAKVRFAIYQHEVIDFSEKVLKDIEDGHIELARGKLQYFSGNQDWRIANDSDELVKLFSAIDELPAKKGEAIEVKDDTGTPR